MQARSDQQFGVVLLGAGSSRRMGRPKLLLPWGTSSVLGHLLSQWIQAGAAQIGAVCAADATGIQAELRRWGLPEASWIVNPDPERGMFSSIQRAAAWTGWQAGLTHFVITLGDQPHLRQATLRELIRYSRAHPEKICQPLRQLQPRHPVVLPKAVFAALASSPAATLKEFLGLRESALAGFDSEDAGLDWDMDTPADYERLRRANGPSAAAEP